MATLQDFYPWITLECPGVPVPLLNDAIRKGLREFCRATHAYEYEADVTTSADQADYEPVLPDDTEILTILYLRESPTIVLSPRQMAYIDAQPAATGDSTMFTVVESNPLSLRLYPTPGSIRDLTAKLVLMPTLTAATIEDKLLDWYVEGVTAYARYYLMVQPGKPWSNPDSAAFAFRQFDARAADTKVRRAQWRSDLPTMVQMRPLA